MSANKNPAGEGGARGGGNRLYMQFDPVFFEKTRLSMMTLIHQEGTVSFNRFKLLLDGTDGAIYGHIQKLLKAGYIRQKKEIAGDKAQTVYSLTASGARLFRDYLSFLETMLHEDREKSSDAG